MDFDFFGGLFIGFFSGMVVVLIIFNNSAHIVHQVLKKLEEKE